VNVSLNATSFALVLALFSSFDQTLNATLWRAGLSIAHYRLEGQISEMGLILFLKQPF
jgi:hypothetical protein